MQKRTDFAVGEWAVTVAQCRITGPDGVRDLEPKVMDMLALLASHAGEVVSRDAIREALWPTVIVGEDALSRTVFKLRRALGDQPGTPRFLETIPKRGYRLIAPVAWNMGAAVPQAPVRNVLAARSPRRRVTLASSAAAAMAAALALLSWPVEDTRASVLQRAGDHYFQYTRVDNSTAALLYGEILGADADNAAALAGLASTLVQRAVRWPAVPEHAKEPATLAAALGDGRLRSDEAQRLLAEARGLAARSVASAPGQAAGYQALGLALAASGDLAAAERAYERAIELEDESWAALISLADIRINAGAPQTALPLLERAYDLMERNYAADSARIRPWQGALGVEIAKRHAQAGERAAAERWFRRTLVAAPLQAEALAELAALLLRDGRSEEAAALCMRLRTVDASAACPTSHVSISSD